MLENPEQLKLLKRVRARGRGAHSVIGGAALSKVFVALIRESDLPAPVAEYQFDTERKWRFDYA